MEEIVLSAEDEVKVEEGEAAATLLDSPVFLTAIERVRAQCAEGFLTSAPHETEVRERLYNLSRGLSAVTEELTAIAALGQTVLENATRPNPEDDSMVQDDPDHDDVDY